MVERSLCMREARGSIPRISKLFFTPLVLFFYLFSLIVTWSVLSTTQDNCADEFDCVPSKLTAQVFVRRGIFIRNMVTVPFSFYTCGHWLSEQRHLIASPSYTTRTGTYEPHHLPTPLHALECCCLRRR
jgi:hypothetical protein